MNFNLILCWYFIIYSAILSFKTFVLFPMHLLPSICIIFFKDYFIIWHCSYILLCVCIFFSIISLWWISISEHTRSIVINAYATLAVYVYYFSWKNWCVFYILEKMLWFWRCLYYIKLLLLANIIWESGPMWECFSLNWNITLPTFIYFIQCLISWL